MDKKIIKTSDYIADMLKVQAELNMKTNGSNYISKEPRTDKGKFIYYPICMKMEAAELLDSLPWKHWKYKEVEYNIPNIKIELIDILHFALSIHLDHFARMVTEDPEKLNEKTALDYANEYQTYVNSAKPDCVNYKTHLFEYLDANVDEHLISDFDNLYIKKMEPYIGYMHYTDKLLQFVFRPNDISCVRNLYEIIFNLYGLTKLIEINPKEPIKLESFMGEIYNMYNAKLALNQLRQDYGYNSGEYIKMWKKGNVEVEDNDFVHDFIANNKIYVTGFDYYKLLKTEYEKQLELAKN